MLYYPTFLSILQIVIVVPALIAVVFIRLRNNDSTVDSSAEESTSMQENSPVNSPVNYSSVNSPYDSLTDTQFSTINPDSLRGRHLMDLFAWPIYPDSHGPDSIRSIKAAVRRGGITIPSSYFDAKKESMEKYVNDTIAAKPLMSAEELNSLYEKRDNVFNYLDFQEMELNRWRDPRSNGHYWTRDPAEIVIGDPNYVEEPASESESEWESQSGSGSGSNSGSTGFPQDSSDVMQTDFDPSDYYEDF